MKVILVDDEPLSLNLFKLECGNMPGFDVVGFFDRSVDALEYARENPVDFALLDIDMPEMNGFELAKSLCAAHPDIIIIFVSSYEEFVYSSFEYCPFRFLRKAHLTEELDITFQKVVEKCILNNETLLFNSTEGEVLLRLKDIIFFEGQKNYYVIYTVSGKEYKCRGTMDSLEAVMKNYDFFRIHASFIVSHEQIESVNNDGFVNMKNNKRLSISRRRAAPFKDAYMEFIRRRISR